MSLRSKAKAAKKRQHLKEQQARELLSIEANAERLRSLSSNFARTERTETHTAMFRALKMPQYIKQKEVAHVEDRWTMGPKRKSREETDEEMRLREQKAREHYERNMKPRVAPAYNKGGDMYLSEGELEAQRHGELRRRS